MAEIKSADITPSEKPRYNTDSDAVEGEIVSSKATHTVDAGEGDVQVLFDDGHLEDLNIVFPKDAGDTPQISG